MSIIIPIYGRLNITVHGLAAGMSRREIERHVADIAEFRSWAGFHRYARLTFAISTAIELDILLMDEWISASDAAFMEKARQRLKAVVNGARVLLLASHNEGLLKRVCNRVVDLDDVMARGTSDHPQTILTE